MKLSFIALGLALSSFNLTAATTGTLILKGTVAQSLSIGVTAESIATTLPLSVTQTNTKVATVNEKSNSNTGYKVMVSSANSSNLKRTSGTELFPYTMKYNGATLNLASLVSVSYAGAGKVNSNRDVTISYTGVPAEDMVAGDYSDTVTFTISAI